MTDGEQLTQASGPTASSPFGPANGSAPLSISRCYIRPGVGLCDECGQPKWPQVYAGYGCMVCLDCLEAQEKAQNQRL